jgi:hypothetical protein
VVVSLSSQPLSKEVVLLQPQSAAGEIAVIRVCRQRDVEEDLVREDRGAGGGERGGDEVEVVLKGD